jgi:hypothetical protein
MSVSDDELDRAVASLTDASPSSALQANVMRRIAGTKVASVRPRARLAFAAAAAVVLVAVSTWFALRPAPAPQTARQPHAPHDITVPGRTAQAGQPAVIAKAMPAAAKAPETNRTATARSRRAKPAVTSDVDVDTQPTEDAPAIPPIDMGLIEEPKPVAIAPVTVVPIEIPQIQIQPMDDRIENNSPPPKGEPRRVP